MTGPELAWECQDRSEPTMVLSQLDRLDMGLPREQIGSTGPWGKVAAVVAGLAYSGFVYGVWQML